jgi:phosphatidylserine/phosphatidylglycerophosphate/cardiolipin synthase-like enzyme
MKHLVKNIDLENDRVIEYPILPHGSGWQSSEGFPLSVLETGKAGKLLRKMIETVEAAQDFICMQSFLMEDTELIEALVKAQARGVRIFVLSSKEPYLKETLDQEPEWDQKAREAYIRLLEEKFKYRFLLRSAPAFHAKYLLVDPKTNPKGFLCTNNFTRRAFRENIELAIELSQAQVEELFKVFVYHFWEHATDEHTGRREFAKVSAAHRFSLSELKHILLTSPNESLNTLGPSLLRAIQKAEKSISLSTFHLDKDHPLVIALRTKAKAGVKVILFTWPMEGYFQQHLRDLIKEGIEVYLNPRTHAKSLLIDGREGYIFTANLKAEGLEKGLEVGVRLNERQTAHLARLHEWWAKDFEKKAYPARKAKDIEKYYTFVKGKLAPIQLRHEVRDPIRKSISTVSELLSFFDQKISLDPNAHRSLKVDLIADIQPVPSDIPTTPSESKFEVVEIEETSKENPKAAKEESKERAEAKEKDKLKPPKKRRFVVIYEDFQLEDIGALSEYRDLRMYYANRR